MLDRLHALFKKNASRRQLFGWLGRLGLTAALGGLLSTGAASQDRITGRNKMAKYLDPLPPGFNPGPLDLEKPLDNQVALLKLQADLSGEPVVTIFPGKAWLWVPDENNYLAFHTYGVGCSRLEYNEEEKGWRFYHREGLFYTDPQSGEVLDTWKNPVTGMTLHEATERMERQLVTRALRDTNGNRSKAARLLGLTRQGLLNKIARYKIEI